MLFPSSALSSASAHMQPGSARCVLPDFPCFFSYNFFLENLAVSKIYFLAYQLHIHTHASRDHQSCTTRQQIFLTKKFLGLLGTSSQTSEEFLEFPKALKVYVQNLQEQNFQKNSYTHLTLSAFWGTWL